MRKINSFSAFEIYNEENFGFNPDDYSKFKHGSLTTAREYGYTLAAKFAQDHLDTLLSKELVVIPSAYSHIPTASNAMALFFIDKVNLIRYQNGMSPIDAAKIYRTVSYRVDYGEMSASQRYNLIKNDRFHIDKDFLVGKTLIFIDDIKITGTHERIIVKMLDDFDIQNDTYMLYYGELKDDTINPRFENYLNQHYVKELDHIHEIINYDEFRFNTRVVKFILNAPLEKSQPFLLKQTPQFVSDLYYLAVGNSYGQFEQYHLNMQMLEQMVMGHERMLKVLKRSIKSTTIA